MSSASAAFEIIPAAVTAFTTVMPDTNVLVLNGYGVTEWAGDFVLVGAADPFTESAAVGIETQQDWRYAGTGDREESGWVNCVAYVRNGDADALAAQTRLKVICTAISDHLRTNYTLGLAEVLWVAFSLTQMDHDQDNGGAWAVANFRLNFEAHI